MGRLLQAVVSVPWVALHRHVDHGMKLKLFEALGYEPNRPQMEFHLSSARFRVICWGRRTGKTTANVAEDMVYGLLGGKVWNVAPTYDLSAKGFAEAIAFINARRDVRDLLAGEPNMAKGSQAIRFKTGGFIEFKSSFKPNSLVGSGLDHISGDEWALENNGLVWTQHLRPTLIDRIGSASFGSTPRGDNQFKDLYSKGQDDSKANWESWQRSTRANHLVSEQEIRELIEEEDMSEADIAQEIEAEFMDLMGAVFRGFAKCLVIDDEDLRDKDDGIYVLGADLAKYEDWTVITIMGSRSGRIVYMERFNSTDWNDQVKRIAEIARRYSAPCMLDATGVGDPIVDMLAAELGGWPVEGFVFTPKSKVIAIRQLARALQSGELKLFSRALPMGRTTANELGSYQYTKTAAGNIKMGAPPGKHDDCVASLALVYECALRYGGTVLDNKPATAGEETVQPQVRGTFGKDDEMTAGKRKVPSLRKRR